MEELALHILDLCRNAVEAGATAVWVTVRENPAGDLLEVEVRDNGRGMTPEQVRAATDPFYTTRSTRRVGLGLSLLQAAAEAAGGGLEVESALGQGTRVRARFSYHHLDRAPLGDLASTLTVVLATEEEVELHYEHWREGRVFRFSTRDLERWLGPGTRKDPAVLSWVRRYLAEGESDLQGRECAGGGASEVARRSGPVA